MRTVAPFGAASTLYSLRLQADQWVAAALFSVASFAAFSIGALLAPLLTLLRKSVSHTFLPGMSRLQAAGDLQGMLQMNSRANVMVGALTRTRDVRHARARARELLERVGLAEKAEAHARTLSTGQRKRLELARALATEPRVLLLDEVTGGVDQRTIPGLVQLVRDLHRDGLTLLVIEHNMRVITAVAQRIVALYLGEKIADGAPDVVTRDRRVVDAYLGQVYTQ